MTTFEEFEKTTFEEFEKKARQIVDKVWRGENHVWSLNFKQDSWGGMCKFLVPCDLSTWDDSKLTWLVVMCHDLCLRAEVSSHGPIRMKISLWPRKRTSEDNPISEACPTLDDHVARIRGEIDTHELQRRMKP